MHELSFDFLRGDGRQHRHGSHRYLPQQGRVKERVNQAVQVCVIAPETRRVDAVKMPCRAVLADQNMQKCTNLPQWSSCSFATTSRTLRLCARQDQPTLSTPAPPTLVCMLSPSVVSAKRSGWLSGSGKAATGTPTMVMQQMDAATREKNRSSALPEITEFKGQRHDMFQFSQE